MSHIDDGAFAPAVAVPHCRRPADIIRLQREHARPGPRSVASSRPGSVRRAGAVIRIAALAFMTAGVIWIPLYPDGCRAASAEIADSPSLHPPRIRLERIFEVEGGPFALAWSPDGKLLAASYNLDMEIAVWHYLGGARLRHIRRSWFGLNWLAFTPDGREVVTSTITPEPLSFANRVAFSFVDVQTGTVRNVQGPEQNPTHVAVNMARKFALALPAGRAAIITRDRTGEALSFYDAETWSLLSTHRLVGTAKALFLVSSMAANPSNGEIVLLGIGGELEVWDPFAARPIRRFQAYGCCGGALAFSPDGHLLATSEGFGTQETARDTGELRLWNAHSWQMVASAYDTPGSGFNIMALSFSPDGRYVAALSRDGRVHLWDGKSLAFVADILDGGTGGIALTFAPDSRHLAIGRNDGVRVVTIDR